MFNRSPLYFVCEHIVQYNTDTTVTKLLGQKILMAEKDETSDPNKDDDDDLDELLDSKSNVD